MNLIKKYRWSGINLQGKHIQGELTARNLSTAKNLLLKQGVLFSKIYRNYSIFSFTRTPKISTQQISIFYRQLSTLIKAGVPIVQSCDILLKNHNNLSTLINTLKIDLENGSHLSTSLRKHPKQFDKLSCQLIAIAETSGTLDKILDRIANHKENLLNLKNKIKQALLYPAIILFVALIATILLLTVVIPQFAELFANFHTQLPYFTVCIIQLSAVIKRDYWLSLFPVFSLFVFWLSLNKNQTFKTRIDFMLIKLPLFSTILNQFFLTRFTKTLATVLSAGIPLPDALKMLIDIHPNQAYQTATRKLLTRISAGQQLHTAMQNLEVFSSMLIQMVKVGEEAGALDQMLEKTAEIYQAELDHWLTNFSHTLEPLIIIILGVLIGGLVIAMYLPIFKLGTVF